MAEIRYPLRGEIDIATAPVARTDLQSIVRDRDGHLVVDCTALRFIDSTGIAVLLETQRDLAAQGRDMIVLNVPAIPRKVFDVLGLTDMLRYDRDHMHT